MSPIPCSALLPITLPQTGTIDISAAYLPASDEASVGGDWYDAFELPDGRTAFSIGDVAGHGLKAAVVMGEVRQAFRAAAVNPKSPSLVLERANTIVNMRADATIVTAIFGIIDVQSSIITYAVAGHPPPIFASEDGQSLMLPAIGIPLGVASRLQTGDWTITLAPGSLFALYTDGLIEHSRNIITGVDELMTAIGSHVQSNDHSLAQNVIDTIFSRRKNIDDAAMLIFKARREVSERFDFTFSAVALAVPLLRRALSAYAQKLGLGTEQEHAVILCIGEAAANAVEHALCEDKNIGLISVHAHRDGENLVIEVRNNGRWKAAEQSEERGRGIPIMRSLCNHLEIKTTQNQTVVRLNFKLFA